MKYSILKSFDYIFDNEISEKPFMGGTFYCGGHELTLTEMPSISVGNFVTYCCIASFVNYGLPFMSFSVKMKTSRKNVATSYKIGEIHKVS